MRNAGLYQRRIYHLIEEYSPCSKSPPLKINFSPYSDPSVNYSARSTKYVGMAGAGQGYQFR